MLGVYICMDGQRTGRMELAGTEVRIGSYADNTLALVDDAVDPHHCTLRWDGEAWTASWFAPVLVNGHRVESPHRLADGDTVSIGPYDVVLALAPAGAGPVDPTVERGLLDAAASGDDVACMVY